MKEKYTSATRTYSWVLNLYLLKKIISVSMWRLACNVGRNECRKTRWEGSAVVQARDDLNLQKG